MPDAGLYSVGWFSRQFEHLPLHQISDSEQMAIRMILTHRLHFQPYAHWIRAGKKLEFSPDGTVKINGARGGKWIWPRANTRSLVALTLDTGNTGYFARLSTSKEGVLYLTAPGSKRIEATRSLP